MVFSTARLAVRDLSIDDFRAFHGMQSNVQVMRYTGQAVMNAQENQMDLERIIVAYHKVDNDFWVWAVMQKSDQNMVGTCALIKDTEGQNEIGYRFLERYWGNGYGMEITGGLIKYAFEIMKVDRLVAVVAKKNVTSVKILDACMNFEEELFNHRENMTDRKYVLDRKLWLASRCDVN